MDLGKVGVWWSFSWKPAGASSGAAGELEELGYGAFELVLGGELIPVTTRHDGDFSFIPREEPAA